MTCPSCSTSLVDTVRTDLPLDRAADLFALYSTVDLDTAKRAVFGPKKFAVRAGGTDYTLVLDLCRAWIAKNFPAERPFGSLVRADLLGSRSARVSPYWNVPACTWSAIVRIQRMVVGLRRWSR